MFNAYPLNSVKFSKLEGKKKLIVSSYNIAITLIGVLVAINLHYVFTDFTDSNKDYDVTYVSQVKLLEHSTPRVHALLDSKDSSPVKLDFSNNDTLDFSSFNDLEVTRSDDSDTMVLRVTSHKVNLAAGINKVLGTEYDLTVPVTVSKDGSLMLGKNSLNRGNRFFNNEESK